MAALPILGTHHSSIFGAIWLWYFPRFTYISAVLYTCTWVPMYEYVPYKLIHVRVGMIRSALFHFHEKHKRKTWKHIITLLFMPVLLNP